MERWQNRVAAVTGASSGIGAAIAVDLVKAGLLVAGLARRVERVEELRATLPENLRGNLHAVKCDVSSDESVANAFDWIEKNLGGVDVLINNAGICKFAKSMTMEFKDLENVVQTNLLGVVRCTQRAYRSMTTRNFGGHVIVINSIVGHKVTAGPAETIHLNIYPATKFAITALCQVWAMEFQEAKTNIKITSVSPGYTDTEIIPEELRKMQLLALKSEDVSGAVLYALSTPQTVQIAEITIKPYTEAP